MANSSEILLESGTNEVEILELIVAEQSYGINVSKVLSIETFEKECLSDLPTENKEVMGVYQYRGETIPILNLSLILKKHSETESIRPLVVCLEFNEFRCCVLVDGVNRIHRVGWDKFESLSGVLSETNKATLGVITINANDILILDIEGIASMFFENVSMETVDLTDTVNQHEAATRESVKLILAEDSKTISNLIIKILKQAGYTNVRHFENGKEAWDHVKELDFTGDSRPCDVVISDIEMPQMDGLSFCKNFRTKLTGTGTIPFVMFSSLINEQMAQKCESVGATGWITKPQIHTLIERVDNYCGITKQ